jgi:hypothetical protein
MVAVMNKTISGLRALVSALLLGVGFSAYAARLDPVSEHIAMPGSTGLVDPNPALDCALPCVTPQLDGGSQRNDAGQLQSIE